MKQIYLLTATLLLLAFANKSHAANDSIYEQRRQAYIDTSLNHVSTTTITLQAYRGVPVDAAILDTMLAQLPTNGTADFSIVELVRILYFSNGAYDSLILPVLNRIPFWLTNGEVVRDYWSENHMCQWISSDWLLHERYNKPVDSRLDYRIRHYLRLKVQYGFYEFLSTDYNPYCLSGLLNLADFAQDAEIKSLATQASQRLLTDLLRATNNVGTCFPTAGRNYYGKYETAYGQNYNNLIYLLTGRGQAPVGSSHSGGFLASSTLPVEGIISSLQNHLDTTMIIGHTLTAGLTINDSLSATDKTLFQWSSGAYFHPEVVLSTAALLTDSNLWGHPDFSQFAIFRLTPTNQFTTVANTLNYVSESSVICNDTVKLFKDGGVTLSSVQNLWGGKLGYEQIPCVANVGTTAVYTASGKVLANWEARPATNENNDLPVVNQRSNVAMVMYRPNLNLPTVGYKYPQVSLHWVDSLFTEVRSDSAWLLGRQGNGYIGVRRGCLEVVNTLHTCSDPHGQTWIIMVGDSSMYGSFDHFQSIIDSSVFTENWVFDTNTNQWNYQAKITVDTTTVSYNWLGDSALANPTTAVENIAADNNSFNVYPNPAQNIITLDLIAFEGQATTLKITDLLGRQIYTETNTEAAAALKTINTSAWANGMYVISIETPQGRVSKLLVKAE